MSAGRACAALQPAFPEHRRHGRRQAEARPAGLTSLESLCQAAECLKTLAHPHRLRIVQMLPDATLVYPAHGAGRMCGKSLSKETVSTIGEQKRFY